jgi:hypothetical protein
MNFHQEVAKGARDRVSLALLLFTRDDLHFHSPIAHPQVNQL